MFSTFSPFCPSASLGEKRNGRSRGWHQEGKCLLFFMPGYTLVVPVSGDIELGGRGRREDIGKGKGDGCCSAGSPAASPHHLCADQFHPHCCRVMGWCWDLPNVQREGCFHAWGGNLGKAHSHPTEEPGLPLMLSVLSVLQNVLCDLPLPSPLQ